MVDLWLFYAVVGLGLVAAVTALWLWRQVPRHPCFFVPKGYVVTINNATIIMAPNNNEVKS